VLRVLLRALGNSRTGSHVSIVVRPPRHVFTWLTHAHTFAQDLATHPSHPTSAFLHLAELEDVAHLRAHSIMNGERKVAAALRDQALARQKVEEQAAADGWGPSVAPCELAE